MNLYRLTNLISNSFSQDEPEFRPQMSEVVDDLIDMIQKEASNRSNGD